MSDTTLKENVLKKWQKGVALLFALGILGLLLVMALGFATNSIFDQLIANNTGNSSAAKTIAQSGLERVSNMLQNYSGRISHLTGANDFRTAGILGYSYSSDTTDFTTSNAGWLTARSDMLSDNRFFGSYTTWNAGTMDPKINWIYLKSDNRIIGRMAYIILNNADLDPGKLVKPHVDESAAAEIRLGAEANEVNIGSVSATLSAAMLKQFNYSNALYAEAFAGAFEGNWIDYQFMFNQFGVIPGFDNAMKINFQRWFICKSKDSPEAFWIDNNADGKITMRRDAAGNVYSEEMIHRFNVARNWYNDFLDVTLMPDKVAVYKKILLSTAASGDIPNVNIIQKPPAGALWTGEFFDGLGIPWLATFGMKDSGVPHVQIPPATNPSDPYYPIWVDDDANFKDNFASVRDRRHQIAANLVDYCIKDSDPPVIPPTSDVVAANWGITSPTFTGNKKTPYINELGIRIGALATRTVDIVTPTDTNVNVTISVDVAPELIDIYGISTYKDSIITIYYDLSYTLTGSLGPLATVNLTDQIGTVNIPVAQWPGVGARYAIPIGWTNIYTSTLPTAATYYTTLGTDAVNIDINSLVLTVKKIILNYNGLNVDCSNIATIGGSTSWGLIKQLTYASNAVGTVTADSFMGFQTNDPRQNLNSGDWKNLEDPVLAGTGLRAFAQYNATKTGTLGIKNDLNKTWTAPVDPSLVAGLDAEDITVTDPAYISPALHLSTAFIRQAPMVSPWELGFIHRGKAWETLNLHKYDVNKKVLAVAVNNGVGVYNIFSAGGGLYADGDANILDQIKMNGYSKNYKIDINNRCHDAGGYVIINSLFTNILSGSTLTSAPPGMTGGNPISAGNIITIKDAIINNTYSTRAQLVNDIATVAPISAYGTKALKDEIIGKFVNLIDFDSYYTVILVAQTIRDVGGPAGTPIVINKKLPGDTLNTSITAELGKFDLKVVIGPPDKYYYADDITSTLKVQALIHKKIDGSCEILSVKYIQ